MSVFAPPPSLPQIVLDEKRRNGAAASRSHMPSSAAITALQRFYVSHGRMASMMNGRYIDNLLVMGGTVRSDDVFVKNTNYNFVAPPIGTLYGSSDLLHETELHEAYVRLIRYKEFMARQEKLSWGSSKEDMKFVDVRDEQQSAMVNTAYAADDLGRDDSSTLDLEDDLMKDQVMALGTHFTNGFWMYVNYERLYSNYNPSSPPLIGVKNKRITPDGTTLFELDISVSVLMEQCDELRDIYINTGEIQGPAAARGGAFADSNKKQSHAGESAPASRTKKGNNKGKKGRNKKHGGGSPKTKENQEPQAKSPFQPHAVEVETKIAALFACLETVAAPMGNSAMGSILTSISDMLRAAVEIDVDIARAVIKSSSSLLRLRKLALKHALDADQDIIGRPKYAADIWWATYTDLTLMLGRTMRTLVFHDSTVPVHMQGYHEYDSSDANLATKFYVDHIEPDLVASVKSKHSAERCVAIEQLGEAATIVPLSVTTALVKNKTTWKAIEDACNAADVYVDPRSADLNKRQSKRERIMAPQAAAEAVRFYTSICQKGTDFLNAGASTPVAPGKLVTKLVQRGTVATLVQAAWSPHEIVAIEAIRGLAHLSRVKDCRLMLLQHPRGVELVCGKIMASSNGVRVSPGILLVTHLLWDAEWREPILNWHTKNKEKDALPVEKIVVRWAAFCMKCICKKGDILRQQPGVDRKEWLEVEFPEHFGDPHNRMLCRCLILLSTLHHAGTERLLEANALEVAVCCLDIPYSDAYAAAGNLISNYMTKAGEVAPSAFSDPDHVVQCVCLRFSRFGADVRHTQRSTIFSMLAMKLMEDSNWARYFEAVANRDEIAKDVIEGLFPFFETRSSTSASAEDSDRQACDYKGSVNASCSELTGQLKKCGACGKMEGKKGDLKACSKCGIVVYCDRNCQRKDWKAHKRVCAGTLAKKD